MLSLHCKVIVGCRSTDRTAPTAQRTSPKNNKPSFGIGVESGETEAAGAECSEEEQSNKSLGGTDGDAYNATKKNGETILSDTEDNPVVIWDLSELEVSSAREELSTGDFVGTSESSKNTDDTGSSTKTPKRITTKKKVSKKLDKGESSSDVAKLPSVGKTESGVTKQA